ncbi:MAG TPA: hypothetical protein VLW52_10590 [Opitutaceae bacterium]|nr:hypothetical protein [Opitutaceae bacterium]
MSNRPLVYLILGAAGSGRREVVADLIGGLADGNRALTLLATGEKPSDFDARLGAVARWQWREKRMEAPALGEATHVFFFTEGCRNPVDQVEAFQAWLATSGSELARILCVVHCALAAQHRELLGWYDACVHFADVVLLNRRDGVPGKWMSDFQGRYARQFLPCLFELVKAGRVKNPALILEPQARRMSHVFDDELNWEVTGGGEDDADAEIEAHPEEDPYLQRRAGGRRVKEIPDVAQYLA